MGQRCVHYTERDNGTRVLYAPNQCYVMCVQTLATALADKLLQFLLVRVPEILYLRTGYTLVRWRKWAGCSLFIRWLLFLATSITKSDS